MYGSSVGSLNIYTRRSTNESLTEQWMKSGEVGDYFVRLEVVLPVGNPFQVILEGVVGDGPNGFIVVDDISFTPGCHVFDGKLTINIVILLLLECATNAKLYKHIT